MQNTKNTQVAVLGAGPGGYSAAFRCADLGIHTTIIERYPTLGGVCLNVGCIPSKTLLDIAKIIDNTNKLSENGIFKEKTIYDIHAIRKWKERIVNQLTNSLNSMAKMRNINIVNGHGRFIDKNNIHITNNNNNTIINFEHAIIATGSHPNKLPFIPYNDQRIWDSTDALELKYIPKNLLIIGSGAIGLEMATIYNSLGSQVDVIELLNQPIPDVDEDITRLFIKYTQKQFNLFLGTQVTKITPKTDGIYVNTENGQCVKNKTHYDTIIVAVGRKPNSELLNLNNINININQSGFIKVDNQMRTNISNIFAIGDVIGTPMLAHKSIHEGHIAAEVIAGMKSYFDPKVIPSVIYTNPEVAWIGFTEKTAKIHNMNYEVANFPWLASGRAITSNAQEGITKLLFNKKTHRIIGGIVLGKHASELLGEIGLAIEMGCDAEDISLTIHAHPSLHETIGLSAAVYEGSITDIPNIKSKINKNLYTK
ncbi:dihydrolipoyl dehydrogenase [Blochmannia endosymbiont of Polyrhachis (Hedomyrma) turneri]|nr:dihydrolipoyl dehydrogenase [Blochmannia endosymbiont of Polyrhachis (Hedomyrma) turneri]AKC59735.1 dihydrolipoyl dehydrogenase [Blochmannia endosymbiont of Polyrhachis (Hedomyrma) turneri]